MYAQIQHPTSNLPESYRPIDPRYVARLVGRLELNEFDAVIAVAVSRNFTDYELFCECLEERLVREDLVDLDLVFIAARPELGADDMIIRWCQENGFPRAEFATDWKQHGRSADAVRNQQIAKTATHLILFWNGESVSESNLLNQAVVNELTRTINLVDPDPEWIAKTTRKQLWQEIAPLRRQSFWNTSRN